MPIKKETLEYRKENDLCTRDGRPNQSGRKMCEYCLKKSAEKAERHRQKKKIMGLCLSCGKPSEKQRLCDPCKRKANIASNKSQIKHYNDCKFAGICIVCSNKLGNGKTLCDQCLADKSSYQKGRHGSFSNSGMCYDCGKNPPAGKGKRCQICIDKRNEWYQGSSTQAKDKNRRDKNREIVLQYYGNKCVQCDEERPFCLAIDHIDGNGNTHRKKIGKYGSGFFGWLIDNNFPDGFQILCHNCNMEKHLNSGVCPHKRKVLSASMIQKLDKRIDSIKATIQSNNDNFRETIRKVM